MGRITGIGGVFFRSKDPGQLMNWYKENLGVDSSEFGFPFLWKEKDNPTQTGYTVWSPFATDTDYFGPDDQPFMINYRVEGLESLIKDLREKGVEIAGEIQEHPNGKFAWIKDLDGTRMELWEPVDSDKDPYL
jgi:predicted enzyme related to lactoylglutathione lyase